MDFEVLCDSADRDAWLKLRDTACPASETASILGRDDYTSAIELYAQRRKDVPEVDLSDRESVFWGNALESAIIAGFEERTGFRAIPFGLLVRSARWPWMIATPDAFMCRDASGDEAKLLRQRIALMRTSLKTGHGRVEALQGLLDAARGWEPLQVKNVGLRMASKWDDGIPAGYQIQALHEALTVQSSTGVVAALIGGQQLAWDDFDANPAHALPIQIITQTRKFLMRVREGERPPPDGSESAKRVLNALFPEPDPKKKKPIELGTVLWERAQLFDALTAEIKARKKEVAQIENEMREAIGDFSRGLFSDGSGFSNPLVKSKGSEYRKLTRVGVTRARRQREKIR